MLLIEILETMALLTILGILAGLVYLAYLGARHQDEVAARKKAHNRSAASRKGASDWNIHQGPK